MCVSLKCVYTSSVTNDNVCNIWRRAKHVAVLAAAYYYAYLDIINKGILLFIYLFVCTSVCVRVCVMQK